MIDDSKKIDGELENSTGSPGRAFRKFPQRGFSAVEMVVYSAILSVVFIIVVNTLLLLGRSYNSFRASNDINNSASIFLERITREIRRSSSVNLSESVFDANPGKLALNSFDSSGVPVEVSFMIDGGQIVLFENGVSLGPLVADNASVPSLVLRYIEVGGAAPLVRVEVGFESERGNAVKSETFYAAAVARGAY